VKIKIQSWRRTFLTLLPEWRSHDGGLCIRNRYTIIHNLYADDNQLRYYIVCVWCHRFSRWIHYDVYEKIGNSSRTHTLCDIVRSAWRPFAHRTANIYYYYIVYNVRRYASHHTDTLYYYKCTWRILLLLSLWNARSRCWTQSVRVGRVELHSTLCECYADRVINTTATCRLKKKKT